MHSSQIAIKFLCPQLQTVPPPAAKNNVYSRKEAGGFVLGGWIFPNREAFPWPEKKLVPPYKLSLSMRSEFMRAHVS